MIGIYKITNKINGKSYIGQSIHCGKRLDEHYKGNQFIDQIIQLEGIQNFTFEILKVVAKEELSLWEDYFIIKYNALFPNGYNKRYNCPEKDRAEFFSSINETKDILVNKERGVLAFPIESTLLKIFSTGGEIYTWLLLHSDYNRDEGYYYINCKSFTYKEIGQDIGKTRQTISAGIKKLLDKSKMAKEPFLYYKQDSDEYIMPIFEKSYYISIRTLERLLFLYKEKNRTGLIAVYFFLMKRYMSKEMLLSYSELIESLGHSKGNKQIYERYKDIMTILRDNGFAHFNLNTIRLPNGQYTKTITITSVSDMGLIK